MMQNRNVLLGIAALIVLAAGAWAFNFVLGEPEAASAPISSVPLELDLAPTEVPEPEATAVSTALSTAVPVQEPVEPTAAPAVGPIIFEINQAESEVRFTLDEMLRGEPKTVVGATDQVAGQIGVDLAVLSTAQVGVIQVNARTLATDNNFRNRAIRNVILETDAYEFITFTPTAISGLPDTAVPGDTLTFQITGDLTIRDITQTVVFDVTATAVSETQLAGTAVTTVQRADFNLVIPEVEGVADVAEAVLLEIDFVATAVE
ncbi:MAG: YceI family protein [Ardenticatenaceae bacterium]|nr:YceI family protein [Ardenticatenaceae bacterium]